MQTKNKFNNSNPHNIPPFLQVGAGGESYSADIKEELNASGKKLADALIFKTAWQLLQEEEYGTA